MVTEDPVENPSGDTTEAGLDTDDINKAVAEITDSISDFNENTEDATKAELQKSIEKLNKTQADALRPLIEDILEATNEKIEKFNEGKDTKDKIDRLEFSPDDIKTFLDNLQSARTNIDGTVPINIDSQVGNIMTTDAEITRDQTPEQKRAADFLSKQLTELAKKAVDNNEARIKNKIGQFKWNKRNTAITDAQAITEDFAGKLQKVQEALNKDPTLDGKEEMKKQCGGDCVEEYIKKIRKQSNIISRIEGPGAEEAGLEAAGGDKAAWDAAKILKLILGLGALGGLIGLAVMLTLIANELTGCYRFIVTSKDTNEKGPFSLPCWSTMKTKAEASLYCDCGTPPDSKCDCGSSLNCNGSSSPGSSGSFTFPDKDQCKSDDSISKLPFCCNENGGCDENYPLCKDGKDGSQASEGALYYAFKIITPLDVALNFIKGAADAVGGGIGKIIMYIGIAVGVLLGAYAIFAIIRSFSNRKSSGGGGSQKSNNVTLTVKKE